MRKLATAAMAASLFIGGMGAAFAQSWHPLPKMWTGGAAFSNGTYTWWPKGPNHGGFQFKGTLEDTGRGDGNNVYVQAKPEARNWSRYNGVQGKKVSLNKLVYEGSQQYTTEVAIRVCRDRGSLHPDNCSVTETYTR